MPKHRRGRCFEFMLACRTEYDRLVSTDVQPPGFVIKKYKRQFKSVTHKPEVVNVGLEQVHVAHGEDGAGPGGRGAAHRPCHTPHGHRRHRARRASTVLQDSIIDPGKAMEGGLTSKPSEVEVVVHVPEPGPPRAPTFTSGLSSPFSDARPRGAHGQRAAPRPGRRVTCACAGGTYSRRLRRSRHAHPVAPCSRCSSAWPPPRTTP